MDPTLWDHELLGSPSDAILASLRRSVGQYTRNYDLL